MSLRLQYTGRTKVPVEIEGLTPSWARSKTLGQIERFEAFHGNQKLPLAELFEVSGTPADGRIELAGDLSGVHWIGAGMSEGEVHVEGNAGRHVGSEMTGGQISVSQDAGDWVGGELHGGLIHIRGHAGNLVGSAYRGSRRGMTGGTILVDGSVGQEIGHTMRRGLLAIGGRCGDFAALNMIAGTILVFGDCGPRPAAGMRRGTLGLFGPNHAQLLPSFHAGCRHRPLYLQLVFRELRRLRFAVSQELFDADFRQFHGDMVSGGKGEVLLRCGD